MSQRADRAVAVSLGDSMRKKAGTWGELDVHTDPGCSQCGGQKHTLVWNGVARKAYEGKEKIGRVVTTAV